MPSKFSKSNSNVNRMNVGIVVPDRRDRRGFTENCKRLIRRQTLKHHLFIVDHMPISDACDIVPRYRKGYDMFSSAYLDKTIKGKIDVIAFMENDDWYAPNYLEEMVKAWEAHGQPEMFGTNYTIYYHLKLEKYFTMRHAQRSNTMNTLIKPGLNFKWPLDHDPFIDSWLWMKDEIASPPLIKKLWEPPMILSIGIKHGIGKLGARHHVDELDRYINDDNGWLKDTVDEESFKFYSRVFIK